MTSHPPLAPIRRLLIVGLTATALIIASATTVMTPSAGASGASPGAVWAQWVQCAHHHGYPTLRDPRLNADGSPNFGSQGNIAKRAIAGLTACKSILRKLPPSSLNPAPTPAQLHKLVQFSQCMRHHGLPDWPDPNADGTFPLPPRIIQLGKLGIARQLQACAKYYSGGISVSHG